MILKPDLRVPEQKTASLSFCQTSPKAFRDWVNQLPMANIGEASRQLYHAIIELNHLFIAPQQRLQLLELIRPKIHFVCSELSRHYLGLAVALPEKQRKVANLSQALQLHAASGYKLCVLEFLDNGGLDKNRKAVSTAIHRAISELAATIVRAHQLYCPSPAQSWLECHRLFRFAHRNKIQGLSVDDDTLTHRRGSSVEDCYKRILLLGCARPNQLRQGELAQVYELFENWTHLVSCGPETDNDSLFVVNMERDTSPVYRSLLEQKPGNDCYNFDTRELSEQITDALHARNKRDGGSSELELPSRIGDTLLTHLSQALGILAKRNFNRIASQGTLEICVGLTATHYYVAGEKTFNEFVKRHHALLVNTSPGGYCAACETNVPSSLQAGEVLGVREQSNHPWSVAVVRWIRQVRNQGTQVGIELLAPSAAPCGVRLIQKIGNSSEYLRGLLLPEISVVNQAATLITPRLPFQSGSRISLLHDGREDQGTLSRKISATGSVSQFELKLQSASVTPAGNNPPEAGTSEDEFDSLWPSL